MVVVEVDLNFQKRPTVDKKRPTVDKKRPVAGLRRMIVWSLWKLI